MDEKQLIEAIRKFFSDTTRSPAATKSGLEDARDEIEILLETLP